MLAALLFAVAQEAPAPQDSIEAAKSQVSIDAAPAASILDQLIERSNHLATFDARWRILAPGQKTIGSIHVEYQAPDLMRAQFERRSGNVTTWIRGSSMVSVVLGPGQQRTGSLRIDWREQAFVHRISAIKELLA